VAALFSTTITYGRLSADNEINACRASGINIHRLLVPAIVLSFIVFGITFSLENYLIPSLAAKIEQLVKRDIQTFAYMKLKNYGYINQGDYALHCGKVEEVVYPQQQADGQYTAGQIQLSNVAFLRHDKEVPLFYGTAKNALILFETDPTNMAPSVSVHLNQIRAFNEERGEMIQIAYNPIGPILIPSLTSMKIKFLSLPNLLEIAKNPLEYSRLKDMIEVIKTNFRAALVYEYLVNQIKEDGECRLKDSQGQYTLTAASYQQITQKDGRIILDGKVVFNQHMKGGGTRKILADKAEVTVFVPKSNSQPAINIEMKNVQVRDSREGSNRFVQRSDFQVSPIAAPQQAFESGDKIELEDILAPNSPYTYNARLIKLRTEFNRERVSIVGKCIAEIHSRLAYSASALVLLLLGAGLGIIFRGGHFVSAFGLSFIPMMVVVVMIMTWKQLSTAGIEHFGTFVIWLGILIVALADFIVLGKVMRR